MLGHYLYIRFCQSKNNILISTAYLHKSVNISTIKNSAARESQTQQSANQIIGFLASSNIRNEKKRSSSTTQQRDSQNRLKMIIQGGLHCLTCEFVSWDRQWALTNSTFVCLCFITSFYFLASSKELQVASRKIWFYILSVKLCESKIARTKRNSLLSICNDLLPKELPRKNYF